MNKAKYVFWFFVWKVYLFLMWAVMFLEDGILVVSVNGQVLGYLNIKDRFIYLEVWPYLFNPVSFCYQLYLDTLAGFDCCTEGLIMCFLALRLAIRSVCSAGTINAYFWVVLMFGCA